MKLERQNIYNNAKLTPTEVSYTEECLAGHFELYGTSAFEKLFVYFAFETHEMPYGTAKARTGCPETWIIDYLDDV